MSEFHGIASNEDLNPNLLRRDTRPLKYKISDVMTEAGGFIIAMIGVLILCLPLFELQSMMDILIIIGFILIVFGRKKINQYPFKKPLDNPKKENLDKMGIIHLGNDIQNNTEVWFSNDDFRTHVLVFGSTGSGKSRFLIGLLYQALLVGSGCMYVDGKGDNSIMWLIYSVCRRLDRIDDFLIINYLTGEGNKQQKEGEKKDFTRLTNTTNPFTYGNEAQLNSLVVGLMRDSKGDEMWKGRAKAMLNALLTTLVWMRDNNMITLSVDTLRDAMPLERILDLTQNTDIPDYAREPLVKYLKELPGYTDTDAQMGQLAPKCYEQHGYLQMQLTEILTDLTQTYGSIFLAPLGEVDFKDLVFNRRILMVLLPALEKDPDALAGLGKLVVAGVRAALAPALGNKVEGDKTEVIDSKPTKSTVPFLLILDEYGYYAVPGFAVVAAQARSLGVSCIFAGQDYPSFKKASEEEAKSTVANTNIKIFMKIEDPTETLEIAEKRGAEADITETSGYDGKNGGYKDTRTTQTKSKKRINVRDLVKQRPGQAHIIFEDTIVRAQFFYADPFECESSHINKFLMVRMPTENMAQKITKASRKIKERFDEPKLATSSSEMDPGVSELFSIFKKVQLIQTNNTESSRMAIGLSIAKNSIIKDISDDDGDESVLKSSDDEISDDIDKVASDSIDIPRANSGNDGSDDVIETLSEKNKPDNSIRDNAMSQSNEFEELLRKSVVSSTEGTLNRKLSQKEKRELDPREQLTTFHMKEGSSKEDAQESADKAIKMIHQSFKYPAKPTPVKATRKDLQDKDKEIEELIKALKAREK